MSFTVRARRFAWFLIVITAIAATLASSINTVSAQTDLNEVHIAPLRDRNIEKQSSSGIRSGFLAIRKTVNLVLVPVTITDRMDRIVRGLEKKNFRIFEGDQEQKIRDFSSQDAPVSLGIILDISGSMQDKFQRAKEAVVEFCQDANPQDEMFLITFSDSPHLLTGFTSNVNEIQNELTLTAPHGRTALLDAIYLGIHEMQHARYSRKALLIISDGGDNNSRYTEGELKSVIEEAGVMIYTIGIYDSYFPTPEERLGPELMSEISAVTGGRSFTIDNPNDLPEVASKIGAEIRNQYLLAYRPDKTPKDGKWHPIKVKLNLPKGIPHLFVYAKRGYYAPSE
jgi:Ca-activated chloride channel homolog